MEATYKQRSRELNNSFKSLNRTIKSYLYFGEKLIPVPKDPIGSDYPGDLNEQDQKKLKELREGRYQSIIKPNLERLCLELDLDQTELNKSLKYVVEILGI